MNFSKFNFLQKAKITDFRILRGIGLVSIFLVIGKLAGASKEVAIAYRYGVSEFLDIYLLAFLVVTWLPGIWVAILQSIYIPLINKTDGKLRDEFTEQFHGFSLVFALVATLIVPLAVYGVAKPFTSSLSPGAYQSFLYTALFMAPVAGISLLVGTYSFQLLAREHHVNTLLEVLPSLVLAAAMLMPISYASTNPLLAGTLIGISAQCVGLILVLKKTKIWAPYAHSFSSPLWKNFKSSIGILVASHAIMSFVDPVSSYLAAQLGSGNVASLGYTNRILLLFLTLGAISISRSILPVLSDSAHSPSEKYAIAKKWTIILFIAGLGGGLICWMFTPFLVDILFSRGEFNQENAASVTNAVRLGIAQLPIYFGGIVLVQLCASLQLYRAMFYSSIIALITKTLFSVILMQYFEFSGIVLASVPMYFCTSLFFILYLEKLKKQNYFL